MFEILKKIIAITITTYVIYKFYDSNTGTFLDFKNQYLVIIIPLAVLSLYLNNLKFYLEIQKLINGIDVIKMCIASSVSSVFPIFGNYLKYKIIKDKGIKLLIIGKILFKITILSILYKLVVALAAFINSFLFIIFLILSLLIISIFISRIKIFCLYILSSLIDFLLFYFVCISFENISNQNIALMDIMSLLNFLTKYMPINIGIQELAMGYYTEILNYSFILGVNISILSKTSILIAGLFYIPLYTYNVLKKQS